MLAIKVADRMLAHCKRMKSSPDNSVLPSKTVLSEKENAGLQYLGGYVLQIFTRSVQESFQMKASKRWPFSKLGNWSMALTHKSWFPIWTVVVYGL